MADAVDPRAALLEVGREGTQKAVKNALSQRADEALSLPTVWFSTGSLSLDRLCRGYNPGGFPAGRIIHLPGEWSTGKSLILDHIFKSCLDQGGLGLCSETEGSRDPHFAKAIGLDLKLLELQRPKTIEELIDQGLAWHDSIRAKPAGKHIPIVWGIDSLDSTQAEKGAKGGLAESGGWHYGGGRSEALGAGLRRVVQRTSRYPTTLIMLNQTRDNVGVMFGPAKTTPMGQATHFYASLEVWLSPSPLGFERGPANSLKLTKEVRKRLGFKEADKGNVIGRWVRAKVTKTKVAPTTLQEADFYIDFRKGVHRWGGLLQIMLQHQQIELSPDGNEVKHGDHKFPDTRAWLGWVSQNMELLERPQEG